MTGPVPPAIPRDAIDALIEYARAMAVYLQTDIEQGIAHGHPEHPQARANVDGWDFVALALWETYEGSE